MTAAALATSAAGAGAATLTSSSSINEEESKDGGMTSLKPNAASQDDLTSSELLEERLPIVDMPIDGSYY